MWEGGAVTEHSVPLPAPAATRRHRPGHDRARAPPGRATTPTSRSPRILARQGRRTGAGNPFTAHRVAGLRTYHKIPAAPVRPTPHDGDVVTIATSRQRARRLDRHRAPLAARRVHHRRADHPRRALADPPHRPSCARASASTRPTAGCRSPRPPRRSASPARPCCTRSNAASSPPSTSTAASEKAYESRSNPTKLDCSTTTDPRGDAVLNQRHLLDVTGVDEQQLEVVLQDAPRPASSTRRWPPSRPA